MKKTLHIEGMSCMNCVRHVEEALNELAAVKTAKVNLKKGVANVKLNEDVNDEVFVQAIDEAGYKVVKVVE